jgi:branched-chain amino acid transport system permease protein
MTGESQRRDNDQFSISSLSQTTTARERWGKLAVYAAVVVILACLPTFYSSPYLLDILILCFVYSIAAVSLRTIIISGQYPLAHGAFMGIGAYVSGMTSRWLGWPDWVTILIGALVAMGVGIVTGFPFSRLRALYYALGSLFFGIAVMLIVSVGGAWTGGYTGLAGIHPLFKTTVAFYYFFLGLAVVSIIALYRFEFCRIGVILKAIAQSHLVASSVGINEGRYRILALSVGCFFVGLAGASFVHYQVVLTTSSYGLIQTLWLFMYVLIGGVNSFSGPIIGTLVLILIPQYFLNLRLFSPYVSAGLLLIVLYLMPNGIAGLPQIVRSQFMKYRKV